MVTRHSAIGGTDTTSYTYDDQNHLTLETLSDATPNTCSGAGGMQFTYDGVGNLTSVCDAGGTVVYGYDPANEVTSVQEPGGNCTAGPPVTGQCTLVAYTDTSGKYHDGAPTKITFPPSTGVVEAFTFDNVGNQTEVKAAGRATTLTDYKYTFTTGTQDKVLRQSVTPYTGTASAYGYNPLNQLCTVATGTTTPVACGSTTTSVGVYSYDSVGNRLTVRPAGSTTTTYSSFNSANELCATSTTAAPGCGTLTYSYDGNGNLTAAPSSVAYAYDPFGHTTTLPGSVTATYADSDQTQIIAAGTKGFATSPLGVAAEYDGTTNWAFTRLPTSNGNPIGERNLGAPANYYFLTDGQGSVVKVINSAGTVVTTNTYGAYGEPTLGGAPPLNTLGYIGGVQNLATGLTKFGARYYQPALGAWTQTDPSGQNPGYNYAASDPVNDTDPTGHGTALDVGLGITALGATGVIGGRHTRRGWRPGIWR